MPRVRKFVLTWHVKVQTNNMLRSAPTCLDLNNLVLPTHVPWISQEEVCIPVLMVQTHATTCCATTCLFSYIFIVLRYAEVPIG
jgi:hypothetical protein